MKFNFDLERNLGERGPTCQALGLLDSSFAPSLWVLLGARGRAVKAWTGCLLPKDGELLSARV